MHTYLALAGLSCLFNGPTSTGSIISGQDLTDCLDKLHLNDSSTDDLMGQLDRLIVEDLQPLCPELNLPISAFQRLMDIHAKWRSL